MALTALDFPASPTNGQLYPDPPVTGQPQYSWNGTQWISSKAAVTQIARTDALGWSGMQINGSMEVSQELGATGISLVSGAANKYAVDGWMAAFGNSLAVFGAFPTDISSIPLPAGGYLTTALSLRSTTKITTLAAGDYAQLIQSIEGYRVSRLGWGTANAQSITVSFWVRATVSGNATLAAYNGAANRSYTVAFTVNSPLTWEYKTITIPGDTSGTWAKGNTAGLVLSWAFAVGTTYRGATGTWTAGFFVGTTSQTNFFTADNNIVSITGVIVLPGIEAPTAAQSPLIMRPYDQELATCQRYFRQVTPEGAGIASNTTTVLFMLRHQPIMRAAPTLAVPYTLQITDVFSGNFTQSTPNGTLSGVTTGNAGLYVFASFSGLTAGRSYLMQNTFYQTAGGVFNFDARL